MSPSVPSCSAARRRCTSSRRRRPCGVSSTWRRRRTTKPKQKSRHRSPEVMNLMRCITAALLTMALGDCGGGGGDGDGGGGGPVGGGGGGGLDPATMASATNWAGDVRAGIPGEISHVRG